MTSGSVIGLEVHCQLTNLATKLFCGCSADYRQEEPNTHVCPVCLGLPGSLPVLNRTAVEDAVMVALALDADVSGATSFYRKNYFYPDMAKNFQISQYDKAGGRPISTGGHVAVQVEGRTERVSISRIHLEEDPGRLTHLGPIDQSPFTLVDYNRHGVALIEIVTDPVLHSPREARLFLQKLRSILEHLGVSDGRLEGAMRCDANISLAEGGGRYVEVKNISSFKEVERALRYEITRQRTLIARGKKVVRETRHWDEVRRLTIRLRTKERESDYRYFPEPDLVPVTLDGAFIEGIAAAMPELPDARNTRFTASYQIPPYDAGVLTGHKALADFFEACVRLYPDAKTVSNWIMTDLLRGLHETNLEIAESPITPRHLTDMLRMIDDGTISGKIGKQVLPEMVQTGRPPRDIVETKGLLRISSEVEIAQLVDRVFTANPQAVRDALTDENAIHYLVGQLMRLTSGRADPQLTNRIIKAKIEEQREKKKPHTT
jgi:aspartyl-tRNA(Asn)/glutamyl-tRNA(Gln) amidotransferase subunit B